jgi:hypothetical protein
MANLSHLYEDLICHNKQTETKTVSSKTNGVYCFLLNGLLRRASSDKRTCGQESAIVCNSLLYETERTQLYHIIYILNPCFKITTG